MEKNLLKVRLRSIRHFGFKLLIKHGGTEYSVCIRWPAPPKLRIHYIVFQVSKIIFSSAPSYKVLVSAPFKTGLCHPGSHDSEA